MCSFTSLKQTRRRVAYWKCGPSQELHRLLCYLVQDDAYAVMVLSQTKCAHVCRVISGLKFTDSMNPGSYETRFILLVNSCPDVTPACFDDNLFGNSRDHIQVAHQVADSTYLVAPMTTTGQHMPWALSSNDTCCECHKHIRVLQDHKSSASASHHPNKVTVCSITTLW